MMSDTALAVAAAGMVPLMLAIAYLDFRHLRIPNWSVLAVLGLFLATGSWGLPLDLFLWRLLYGVIALVAGFALYSVLSGQIGAGDLKLFAVLVPFLSGANWVDFLILYALLSIAGLLLYFTARKIVAGRTTGYRALDKRGYFPAGILLGLSMSGALLIELGERMG